MEADLLGDEGDLEIDLVAQRHVEVPGHEETARRILIEGLFEELRPIAQRQQKLGSARRHHRRSFPSGQSLDIEAQTRALLAARIELGDDGADVGS